MKEEDILIGKFGRDGGWKVPDGYFDSLSSEIEGKLPEYPSIPARVKMTPWQKVKPYVYLAAMFAGIWLMMQVFHNVSSNSEFSLDNPPERIAQIIESGSLSSEINMGSSLSDMEIEQEVSDLYTDIDDFEHDFGVTLKPEYDKIKI